MKACSRCSQPDRRRWVHHTGKCPKAPAIEILELLPPPCTGEPSCVCFSCQRAFLDRMARRMFCRL